MEESQIAQPPSGRTLFMVLGGGLVAAGLLLVCIILPAEFGIDPLGTGKAMGLTGLAQATTPVSSQKVEAALATGGTPGAIAEATIAPVLQPAKVESRWGESAIVTGAFIAQPVRFHVDSREITLGPGEGMEIKYHMQKSAGLVYSWTASAPVLYDFHGQPDVAPPGAQADDDYFESYSREDVSGKGQFHGTLVAPTTGIHGWYWENTRAESVEIKIVAAGFYDWVYQNRDEQKTRLRPTDADSLPVHPKVPDEPMP